MQKRYGILVLSVLLLSQCQKTTRAVGVSPVAPIEPPFGPVVTPVDGFFRSLAVTYQTPSPEKTSLTFTMTGDIDWHLERPHLTTLHHVVFEDVEEEAVYTFLPKNFSSNQITTITTAPFTKTRPFSFAIMRLSALWTNTFYPAFAILVADQPTPTDKQFLEFSALNASLVHHAILCPTFGLMLQNTPLSEEKPWYWFSYGRAIVIILKTLPPDPLYLYLSEDPLMENFIIAIDFDENQWQTLKTYEKVAHLIRFSPHTESLSITLTSTITTLYSYKK